jgi:anaerobic magnesium-protoporphyrin IX monomethyl ester cyclase
MEGTLLKALLIYPTPIAEIPHSLALLAAILKQEGVEVHTIINKLKSPLSIDDFVDKAVEVQPDIIGISMMTIEVLKVYRLIRRLKYHEFFVVVGGAHATSSPDEIISHGADIVVRNEGEEAMREIVRGVPLKDILGITYRNGSTPDRPRMKDLSKIPRPDFTAFDREKFRADDGLIKGINRVSTSRGCPGKCTYCDWQVFGHRVSYYPIDEVIADIQDRVDKYGITNFLLCDECFTTNKKHIAEFCEKIVKVRPHVVWQGNARADQTTPEMMRMMKEAGCFRVTLGLESGDPETLKRVSKGATREQNIAACHMAADAGMQVGVNLMFGFPWETVESLNNTLDMVYQIWDDAYLFQVSGAVIPFPGTQLYREQVNDRNRNYWLNPKFQGCGVQLYQNATNPYAVSTFYQRNMYDDTYVQEEYFFPYSEAYKRRLSEVIFETGRHNLEHAYPGNPLKQKLIYNAAKLSRAVYRVFPNLERGIGKMLPVRRRPPSEDLRNVNKGLVKSL